MRFDLFSHIKVVILYFCRHCILAILLIQKTGGLFKKVFLLGKFFAVMIADNIIKMSFLHITVHVVQMVKALISFRIHGILKRRKKGLEFHAD